MFEKENIWMPKANFTSVDEKAKVNILVSNVRAAMAIIKDVFRLRMTHCF